MDAIVEKVFAGWQAKNPPQPQKPLPWTDRHERALETYRADAARLSASILERRKGHRPLQGGTKAANEEIDLFNRAQRLIAELEERKRLASEAQFAEAAE